MESTTESHINYLARIIEDKCNALDTDEIQQHIEWVNNLMEITIKPSGSEPEQYVDAIYGGTIFFLDNLLQEGRTNECNYYFKKTLDYFRSIKLWYEPEEEEEIDEDEIMFEQLENDIEYLQEFINIKCEASSKSEIQEYIDWVNREFANKNLESVNEITEIEIELSNLGLEYGEFDETYELFEKLYEYFGGEETEEERREKQIKVEQAKSDISYLAGLIHFKCRELNTNEIQRHIDWVSNLLNIDFIPSGESQRDYIDVLYVETHKFLADFLTPFKIDKGNEYLKKLLDYFGAELTVAERRANQKIKEQALKDISYLITVIKEKCVSLEKEEIQKHIDWVSNLLNVEIMPSCESNDDYVGALTLDTMIFLRILALTYKIDELNLYVKKILKHFDSI